MASAAVGARVGEAVVDVHLAVGADEPSMAVALVVVDKVKAGAAVLAGVERAVVHVDLAVASREARRATALEAAAVVGEAAGSAVLARRGAAMVDFDVAVDALELSAAAALVAAANAVDASGVVLAGGVGTRLSGALAVAAVVAQRAHALVVVHSRALKKKKRETC